MYILGINFGKKTDTKPVSTENQTEKKSYEKVIIKKEIEIQKSLFNYLKQEIFDNIVSKDENFNDEYCLKNKDGQVIFFAKKLSDTAIHFEYYDKSKNQSVSFEDSNGDGNMNSVYIYCQDGTVISAFDKDSDGFFDVFYIKDKISDRMYNEDD